MNKNVSVLVVLVVSLILIGGATWWYNGKQDVPEQSSTIIEDPGPKLTITTPAVDSFTSISSILIEGTVDDINAKITMNEIEVANNDGQFSHEYVLATGSNEINIIAENVEGYRSVKELRVDYQK